MQPHQQIQKLVCLLHENYLEFKYLEARVLQFFLLLLFHLTLLITLVCSIIERTNSEINFCVKKYHRFDSSDIYKFGIKTRNIYYTQRLVINSNTSVNLRSQCLHIVRIE